MPALSMRARLFGMVAGVALFSTAEALQAQSAGARSRTTCDAEGPAAAGPSSGPRSSAAGPVYDPRNAAPTRSSYDPRNTAPRKSPYDPRDTGHPRPEGFSPSWLIRDLKFVTPSGMPTKRRSLLSRGPYGGRYDSRHGGRRSRYDPRNTGGNGTPPVEPAKGTAAALAGSGVVYGKAGAPDPASRPTIPSEPPLFHERARAGSTFTFGFFPDPAAHYPVHRQEQCRSSCPAPRLPPVRFSGAVSEHDHRHAEESLEALPDGRVWHAGHSLFAPEALPPHAPEPSSPAEPAQDTAFDGRDPEHESSAGWPRRRSGIDPELSVEEMDRLMAEGMAAFAARDYEEASERFHRVGRSDPANIDAWLAFVLAQFAAGDYGASSAAIRDRVRSDPEVVDAAFDLRKRYGEPGDFPRHLEAVQNFVFSEPKNADGWLVLGFVRHFSGERDAARRAFLHVRQRFPEDADVAEAFLD
jgi:hypothetical protein